MTPQQRRRAKQLRAYAAVRQLVIERDLVCRVCGEPGTEVHHIFGRIGKRLTDTSKMILLCTECHRTAHANLSESRRALPALINSEVDYEH